MMAERNARTVKKANAERIMLQVPLTEAERRRLKHEAIDRGVTLREIVRTALGLPANVEQAENAAM